MSDKIFGEKKSLGWKEIQNTRFIENENIVKSKKE